MSEHGLALLGKIGRCHELLFSDVYLPPLAISTDLWIGLRTIARLASPLPAFNYASKSCGDCRLELHEFCLQESAPYL